MLRLLDKRNCGLWQLIFFGLFKIASLQELWSDKLIILKLMVLVKREKLLSDIIRWAEGCTGNRTYANLIRIYSELRIFFKFSFCGRGLHLIKLYVLLNLVYVFLVVCISLKKWLDKIPLILVFTATWNDMSKHFQLFFVDNLWGSCFFKYIGKWKFAVSRESIGTSYESSLCILLIFPVVGKLWDFFHCLSEVHYIMVSFIKVLFQTFYILNRFGT